MSTRRQLQCRRAEQRARRGRATLIAGLVVLTIIASVTLIGTTISTKFYGPLSARLS
jgi:uncharacterized membrane protein SpoIIM required for sporulation